MIDAFAAVSLTLRASRRAVTALGSRPGASLARWPCWGTSGTRLGEDTSQPSHTGCTCAPPPRPCADPHVLKPCHSDQSRPRSHPKIPQLNSRPHDRLPPSLSRHLSLQFTIAAPTHEGPHIYQCIATPISSHPAKSPIARLLSHLRGIPILFTSVLGPSSYLASDNERSVHALRYPMSFERLRYLALILLSNPSCQCEYLIHKLACHSCGTASPHVPK
jgi:hypothetical protein